MLFNKKNFILLGLMLFSFNYLYAVQWTINITNNTDVTINTTKICSDSNGNALEVKSHSLGTCYAITRNGSSYSPYWPDMSYYPISISAGSENIGAVMIDDINDNTKPFNNLTAWHPIFFNTSFAVGYYIVYYMDQNQIQLKSITIDNNNQPVVDVVVNNPQPKIGN